MRRRLLAAILVLMAGTLVVAAVASFVLIRRDAASTAEQELYTEADALATFVTPPVFFRPHLAPAVKKIGGYDSLTVVGLTATGSFTSDLPSVLRRIDLRPGALARDLAVTGTVGHQVYVLIPLDLTTSQKRSLPVPVPYEDTAVLLAIRTLHEPVGGLGVFLLVAVVCLVAAGVVAYELARRFSRPLVTAAQATERIAAGQLDTPIAVSGHEMPEFASLANAINTMSERLRRARDQQRHFLLSVSHELRTPLTSIRGYADAIAEGATDDVPGAVAVIDAEARRLERLVRDLLDLARLDAERFSFDMATVDAAAVAAQTADHLHPEAAAAGLQVTLSLPTDGPLWVLADSDRLHQLLSNLLENAIKFAREHITMGARAEAGSIGGSGGTHILFWVEDDGPGIPPDELPMVFLPHFTSDRAVARRTGTGLGLAIVAELATAMGGGVRAESPVAGGHGTRMVAWLPADPGARVAGAAPGGGL